ncbi:DUF2336 domain-containing protein [Maritalea sp.]|jgi:hypothetical protein|uniref:DUF2336 domain-containing protein n=1 Tax=Maritalea sp. TaxID=2003361 RepID=UPI0039E22D6A
MELLNKVGTVQSNGERRKLAHEVVNLFLHTQGSTSQGQRNVFGDVLCRLLNDMAHSMQIELSNKVCATTTAPPKLVRALAVSTIDVAEPVLTRSSQLRETDLIEVANSATTDHRLAISKREYLSENVTDSLIKFEEGVVMQAVAANDTANISSGGFSTLAKNSGSDAQIMQALINREDLPPKTAEHILNNVDENGKAVLERLIRNDSSILKRLIAKSKRFSAEGKSVEDPNSVETLALIQQIENDYSALEPALKLLTKQSRLKSIATILAVAAKLPEDGVIKGVVNISGDFLALVARALEISSDVYAEMEALRGQQMQAEPHDPDMLTQRYDNLNPNDARSMLRMVNVIVNVG